MLGRFYVECRRYSARNANASLKKCGQAAFSFNTKHSILTIGFPRLCRQTRFLEPKVQGVAFRIPLGSSAWDAHTGITGVSNRLMHIGSKKLRAFTNTAGEFLSDWPSCLANRHDSNPAQIRTVASALPWLYRSPLPCQPFYA